MSSPITIRRSTSPSSSSDASSSFMSTSSSGSNALIYTRDELLALATSPLAQSPAPAHIHNFPQIVRKTRRGVVEAFQALEYARSTNVTAESPRSSTASSTVLNSAPHKGDASPVQAIVPVWHTDVYVPPARRVSTPVEQRVSRVGGRDLKMRVWRRMGPVQARW